MDTTMGTNLSIMELIAGFDAYGEAEELDGAAESTAPATTPYCAGVTHLNTALKTLEEGC